MSEQKSVTVADSSKVKIADEDKDIDWEKCFLC